MKFAAALAVFAAAANARVAQPVRFARAVVPVEDVEEGVVRR